jgi:hypothetical protein
MDGKGWGKFGPEKKGSKVSKEKKLTVVECWLT